MNPLYDSDNPPRSSQVHTISWPDRPAQRQLQENTTPRRIYGGRSEEWRCLEGIVSGHHRLHHAARRLLFFRTLAGRRVRMNLEADERQGRAQGCMANDLDVQNVRRLFNTLKGNYDEAAISWHRPSFRSLRSRRCPVTLRP